MTTVNEEGKALVEQSTFDKGKALAEFMEYIHTYLTDDECNQVLKAFELADKAHEGQLRASGEPYIMHPLAVADILAHLQIDHITLMAALMHDVVEDTSYSKEDLEEMFGSEVAFLVDGVTKLNQFQYETKEDRQMENYRKMILAMAKDVRVVVIKLGDRLHNMRTLKHMRSDKQKRIAKETLEIFAPLAHRLGIFNVKWELEDLSFRYLEPEKYYDLVDQMKQKRQAREDIVNDTMSQLTKALGEAHIKADIKGRPKHFYSIYKKMKKDNRDLSQIYDLLAVRVIVDTIPDCYAVLGIAHSLWKPLPYRFKDYISMPKSNMYQSLHTTVIGTMGQPVEIQIRTWEMHRVSEYGVAAHWRYKEGNKNGDKDFDQKVAWLRQVLEWQDTSNPTELVNALKLDVFSGEVFVFTPKGDLYKLPKGATILDFAFLIHTGLGSKCVGAIVNGKNQTIRYELKSGDTIEILTSPAQSPKQDWLNIVSTSKARVKIKQALKESQFKEAEFGKELLQRRFKNRKIEMDEALMMRLIKKLGFKTATDFYYALASEHLDVNVVFDSYLELERKENEESTEQRTAENYVQPYREEDTTKEDVLVIDQNLKGIEYKLSKCCNPIYGDEIFGFVSTQGTIKIHRVDCPNATEMRTRFGYRVVKARWSGKQGSQYVTVLRVVGHDDIGIVTNITSIISKEKNISMRNISIDSNDGLFQGHIAVMVDDITALNSLIKKLKTVKGVKNVERMQ